jgi:hypothetical protein
MDVNNVTMEPVGLRITRVLTDSICPQSSRALHVTYYTPPAGQMGGEFMRAVPRGEGMCSSDSTFDQSTHEVGLQPSCLPSFIPFGVLCLSAFP